MDTQTDADHCGACATQCGANTVCNAGVCACFTGYRDCATTVDGCETDINTDPNNCGTCGYTCGNNEVCRDGVCIDFCSTCRWCVLVLQGNAAASGVFL